MELMDLLEVVKGDKIHISEASDGLPTLFYGEVNNVPPHLHYRKVTKVSPGTIYDSFALFVTLEDHRYLN